MDSGENVTIDYVQIMQVKVTAVDFGNLTQGRARLVVLAFSNGHGGL